MNGQWIDISVPLRTGMVHWPGDPDIEVRRVLQISGGDGCNVSTISSGTHVGTHMDPPLHFVANGKSIDEMPFDATIGACRVIRIQNTTAVTRDELEQHKPNAGERIMFRTRNSDEDWVSQPFRENFVHVSPDAAAYLVECGVQTVGVDYLSVGKYNSEDGKRTHELLLQAGIWIIEGLNLGRVEAGTYHLVCLPLRIHGGDGAPCRAVLQRMGGRV